MDFARNKGITAGGTAQSPSVSWTLNPDGPRTIKQAVEIARRNGVPIPSDIHFGIVSVEDGLLDARTYASYGTFSGQQGTLVQWSELYHEITGKIPVRIREDVLASDEAIVAIFTHEMHELNALRLLFAAYNGAMPIERLSEAIGTGFKGNLHDRAWDAADAAVLRMRGPKL